MPDPSHTTTTEDAHGASAVESTHAGTAEHPPAEGGLLKPEIGVAFWTFVTFAILLVVMKKLAWGPMLATLDKREQAIRDSLAEAEKARAAASSSIEEQGRLLAEARREAQDLLAKAREDSERSREEIVQKAREEGEKLIESGRRAIQLEKRAAIHEVRNAAIDLVMTGTSKLLRSKIDDKKSRELVEANLRELEQSAS